MSDIDRAELRRLLDEAELPWTVEEASPGMGGPNWLLRREGKAGIIISAYEYGFRERGRLIVAAANALPGLLDVLDVLDVAEATIERVRELHRPIDVDVLQSECAAEECEHEFDCPPIEMTVCKGCYDLGDRIDTYNYERGGIEHTLYPCPTVRALGGDRRHEYDHHLGYASEHHEHVEPVCSACHHEREVVRNG